MLEINRFRLSLYEMLYDAPVCDYSVAQTDMEKSEINVLFIGEGQKALETYKTLFWASQYPGSLLKMTFMGSASDVDYVRKNLDDKHIFPALEEYIEKNYADKLQYKVWDDNHTVEQIKQDIQELNEEKLYSYIIIATGDAYADWEYLVNIESICEKNDDKLKKVLIGIYNDGMNSKFSSVDWSKVAKNVSVLQFEKSEEEVIKSDLRRVAANINLSYSAMYDERLNVKNNLKEFDELCREEFDGINTRKYNADSSYASAVHISAKLSYCLQYAGRDKSETDDWKYEALQILTHAVKEESELYKKLYYWEHRRWNAYTVMRGYRHPEKGEWGFVYSEGRKNVDLEAKLHVCLCESGEELNPDMKSPSFWKTFKKKLNPLDYASYYCNSIAAAKTKELEKRIYSQYDFINGIIFRELKEAIQDLFLESGNANDNYKKVMKKVLNRPDIALDELLLKELKKMDEELGIVVIRNQHINFFEYDAQLVRLIAFSLWHGKKYKEVFVFSNGVPAKDVIVPTLLYAEKVYFVSNEVIDDKFKYVVKRYFEERGGNTESEFISYSEMLDITKEKNADEFVIAGEGELKEDYLMQHSNVVNVRYDPKKNALNHVILFCGLNSQSFSVKEFIHLQGGDIKEEFRDTLSKKTYNDFEKLFWNFSNKTKSGNYEYIPWNKVIKIFTKDSREGTWEKNGKKKNKVQVDKKEVMLTDRNPGIVYICETIISQEKYLENAVDFFLTELYDYHLIGKYKASLEDENIKIKFITYHKEICEIVCDYADNNVDCRIARLNFEEEGLVRDKLIELSSKEFSIVVERNKEEEFFAYQYETLLKELIKLKALDRYDVKGKLLDKVVIKDVRILNLFEKEGDVFEKITFHRFKNSNMFSDIKNGVYFYWNREAQDRDIQQKKLKVMIEKVACQDILNLIDADTFCQIHNEVYHRIEQDYENHQVSNEIDVIAIRGMQAYFISCKATSEIKKEHLDEIANHAKNAGAVPVLAIGKRTGQNSDAILSRAKELNHIVMLGRDELIEQEKFNEAISTVVM